MTYFCKSSRAELGVDIWDKIFEKCSNHEFDLAQEIMVLAGIPNRVVSQQLEILGTKSLVGLMQDWEKHFGYDREKYFLYCYQKAKEILNP